ncbi:MAG: type II toxin-antitoxin system Phd/YefM family antitoxin [Oscillospiraceae bacterium]|jgi:antitoxin YefM|nr:type II toxin-antitoxin system Phd/YefM family antitoxin [Oscillospiraceae bacterium]
MLAVNYSTIQNNLEKYCDRVTDESEILIVTRKGEKNVVILSLENFNAMMKAARNAKYLEMIDRSLAQFEKGEFVTKTMDEEKNIKIISCSGHYE